MNATANTTDNNHIRACTGFIRRQGIIRHHIEYTCKYMTRVYTHSGWLSLITYHNCAGEWYKISELFSYERLNNRDTLPPPIGAGQCTSGLVHSRHRWCIVPFNQWGLAKPGTCIKEHHTDFNHTHCEALAWNLTSEMPSMFRNAKDGKVTIENIIIIIRMFRDLRCQSSNSSETSSRKIILFGSLNWYRKHTSRVIAQTNSIWLT